LSLAVQLDVASAKHPILIAVDGLTAQGIAAIVQIPSPLAGIVSHAVGDAGIGHMQLARPIVEGGADGAAFAHHSYLVVLIAREALEGDASLLADALLFGVFNMLKRGFPPVNTILACPLLRLPAEGDPVAAILITALAQNGQVDHLI